MFGKIFIRDMTGSMQELTGQRHDTFMEMIGKLHEPNGYILVVQGRTHLAWNIRNIISIEWETDK